MIPRTVPRMPWHDLPADIRVAVEDILGSRVVSARSQPGGFSPGSADRVLTADGGSAFVKTGWAHVNSETPEIHRREARIAAALPAHIPAPRLLGSVDLGEWVAVVFEDVEGRHPVTPWRADELTTVLGTLRALSANPVGGALGAVLPPLHEELRSDFAGWQRILDSADSLDSPDSPLQCLPLDAQLQAWLVPRLPAFVEAADASLDDLRGDRLVHLDGRADNILIRPEGGVILVDWPWGSRGAAWFDALTLLVNVRLYDPHADVESIVTSHPVFEAASREAVTRVLIGLAGFFIDVARRPPAAGIPTLRRFQLDQGIATLQWLRERGA